MKVFVTGAGGQLGRDVLTSWRAAGDDVIGADREAIDVTDAASVVAAISDASPDVVVNCAAYNAVDASETNEQHAFAVNEGGVRNVAEAAREVGAHLIHLSTDYVFDGRLDRPYREDDPPNPMSAYGRSKRAGEIAAGPDATVVRTSWVCGEHGHNMVRLVLRLLGEDRPLAFVDDQRGHPTFTADLAPALRTLAIDRPTGLVHLTNQRPVTWFEFVREVVESAGRDPSIVRPISTADLDPPRPAPRPMNSVLDNAVWRNAGKPPLRDFRAPLDELVERLT